ncbi:ankyrin repeat domain-containing protein [Legionella micdadei]|uniref:ankyrin repeat domain-containing protein n=1 Tax=Legionella micdadei TaxID=451 RepID=UPI0009EF6F06|nr:ankyrin repeat domain-containing protein [Legionella micdadei]ARH01229.1 hypothetical protein B6V88_12915 [Legionella micdadei]
MQFQIILQWINSDKIVHFWNKKITYRDLEQEYSAIHELNRRLIAEVRIARFSSSFLAPQKLNELEKNNNLLTLIDLCRPALKETGEATSFLMALHYLLALPKDARPANHNEKTVFLFNNLLKENPVDTLKFYHQNKELFAEYYEINSIAEKTIRKEQALPSVRAYLETLTDALKDQKDPLGLIALFKEKIADTEKYAALILWLIQRKVPSNQIIETHLLHDFMRYNLYDLSSPDSAVSHLYSLLEEFPEAQNLVQQAKKTSCGERGFCNYALDGSLVFEEEELEYVEAKPALCKFSPTAFNFGSLCQLFDQSFLIAAISWVARTENTDWFILLKGHLNQPGVITEQLPILINLISKAQDPKLTKTLATLIEDSTAEQLVSLHQGAILHLLSYKPSLVTKISGMNIENYVEQIISTNSSDFDTTMQLLQLLKLLIINKHDAANSVFERLIDFLLSQQSNLIEDDEIIRQLKRHPEYIPRLSYRCKVLHSQLQDCIEANTQSQLDTTCYNSIEDVWFDVNRKLNLLHILDPQSDSEVIDKYSLYALIAKAAYKSLGRHFDLDTFIEALSLPEPVRGETSIQERVLIEILAAIEDEDIKDKIITKLQGEPINCMDWMTKAYGGTSLFVKAAEHGNNMLLNLLVDNREPDKDSYNDAVHLSAANGHWLTVSHLCRHFPEKVRNSTIANTLILAARHGKVDIVEQLCDTEMYPPLSGKAHAQLLETAVENNQLAVVECLCTLTSPVPNKNLIEKLFNLALKHKHLTILIYFSELPQNAPHQLQIDKAFSQAVLNNDEDSLKCLGNLNTVKPGHLVVERNFKKAAMMGLLNMIVCLGNLPGYTLNKPEIINGAIQEAATYGHLPVVKHLLSSIKDTRTRQDALVSALSAATKSGKLEIIGYLCNLSSSQPVQNAIFPLLLWAIKSKNSPIVELFCNLKTNKPHLRVLTRLLQEAIKSGELDIVKSICQAFSPIPQRNLDLAIPMAVQWRQPIILSYLYELSENKPKPKMIRFALNKAISTNQENAAIYLRNKLLELRYHTETEQSDLTHNTSRQLESLGLFGKEKSGKADPLSEKRLTSTAVFA